MARADSYSKNNTTDIPEMKCHDGYLVHEPIKEYHPETGSIETIGHLWFCTRRLRPKKPDTELSFVDNRFYQDNDCQSCAKELNEWRANIKVDFTKTKLSKQFFRNWIADCVRRKCRTFLVNAEAIKITPAGESLMRKVIERESKENAIRQERKPAPVIDYNPDQFTEQEDIL